MSRNRRGTKEPLRNQPRITLTGFRAGEDVRLTVDGDDVFHTDDGTPGSRVYKVDSGTALDVANNSTGRVSVRSVGDDIFYQV